MIYRFDDLSEKKKHLYSVDYIRAFASLAVAIFHLGGKVLPILKLGWLGVEMFFVLSGFIICYSIPDSYSYDNIGTFLLKRITRIEPPYIFSIILLIMVNLITIKNYKINWTDTFLHFGYLNSFFDRPYFNPVYWTLGIEFQFYFFIAFAILFLKGKYGTWMILILSAMPLILHLAAQSLISFFYFFCLGMLTFFYKNSKISFSNFILNTVIITSFGFIIYGWLEILVAIATMALIMSPLKSRRLVAFFSKISYSLYLTHDIIGSRLVILLGGWFPKTIFFKGGFFLVGIAVSILFAWLYYSIIEKAFIMLSKKITYKNLNMSENL